MRILSRSTECTAARALGLTLIADRRGPPSPRGNATGKVVWEAPEGLLVQEGATSGDDECGWTRVFRVQHGPHAGRLLRAYSGCAWWAPSLGWA